MSREPFPFFPLSPGFAFTWYRSGYEEWWFEIQRQADKLVPITRETFWKYFGAAPEELPKRQCFLLNAKANPIGTATAWFDNNYHGEVWGRLHWVAILPEFQGRGLAKPLMSVVCERMREFHPECAFLRTVAERRAALALYLKFGFVPEIRTDEQEEAWALVLGRIPVGEQ